MTQSVELPSFTGLLLHREPEIGYSFFVPNGWQRQEMTGAEGTGVLYAPTIDEPFTSFSADGKDLGMEVTPDDLPDLRVGFLRGLRKLPRSRILESEDSAVGRLITLEARHTYRDGAAVRKRWVRLLYQGSLQVRLVAQAASVKEFDYWLPMFYQSMRTFRFGDWAVDIGMVADDWLPADSLSRRNPHAQTGSD